MKDDLLELFKVGTLHGLGVAGVKFVTLLLMLEDAGIGLAELLLVEGVTKLLGGFLHLLVDLLLVFGDLILDEHIGTIAFLRVAVVDERVVESVDVTAGLPYGRVHEDGGVNAHDIVVKKHHAVPPVLLDIVFQFYTIWSVIIDGCESVRINV